MAARFRIRTSQGQELSFASLEGFREFVRSGDLAPDDLVYDAETGEWAPGRTHPLVLEVEYEREAADEAPKTAEGKPGREAGAAGPRPSGGGGATAPDLGLSLADSGATPAEAEPDGEEESWARLEGSGDLDLNLTPILDTPSPEEAARAFVERMKSERERDREFGDRSAGAQGIRMESSLADMVEGVAQSESSPAPEPTPVRPPARPPRPSAQRPRASRGRTSPAPEPRVGAGRKAKAKRKGGAARKLLMVALVSAALALAGYFGAGWFLEQATGAEEPVEEAGIDSDPEPPTPQPEPAPEPVIASTPEAVRERARERYLSATQALIAELDPIPEAWLSGPYFSLPSEYGDVRAVWAEYLSIVRRVRSGEESRYRTAYEEALDDAGIREGDARAGRLSEGMSSFRARLPEIDGHWGRAEALASGAIQSHDALLEAEGVILYDPSGATGRTDGIGHGTSGRNGDAQLLLEQVVDLSERTLLADGAGPREGANVRAWVWGGFLDVMSR